jgi:hypothetical protein
MMMHRGTPISLVRLLVAFVVMSALVAGMAAAASAAPERLIFVHYRVPRIGLGIGPPPITDSADDYKWAPKLHWDSAAPSIVYRIDSTNSWGLSASSIATAVDEAFQTWTLGDDNVTFVAGAPISLPADPLADMDGINSVSWRSLGPAYGSVIALTNIWYNSATKIVAENDTVFNDDLSWSITPYTAGNSDPTYAGPIDGQGNPTSFDVTNIGTHEFGHWLVLGDLRKPLSMLLTMYGYSSEGETSKDTLGAGDILGIQKIYPLSP